MPTRQLGEPPTEESSAADVFFKGSLWNTVTPIIQAAFLFLGAQLYFAIDGLRTTVALIQTAQAVSARDIARFDSVKVQRDAELNDLHRQIAELTTAVAVLREGVKK